LFSFHKKAEEVLYAPSAFLFFTLVLDAAILLISSKKQSAEGNENKTEANA
jgi:hypothetical protein